MGSLGVAKTEQLANSLHDALSGKGDEHAHQEKFKAAQKLLTEATHSTTKDAHAQKEVVQAINKKVKADGFCAEGYGSDSKGSYLIMRPLNYGDSHKARGVYDFSMGADGHVDMKAIEHKPGKDAPAHMPRHNAPEQKPGQNAPEQKPGQNAPEQKPGQNAPEQKPGQNEPEQKPAQNAPEQKPGQNAPEQKPGQNAAETNTVLRSSASTNSEKHAVSTAAPSPVGLFDAANKQESADKQKQLDPMEVQRIREQSFKEAIDQSNYFSKNQEVVGQIRDGFRDGGKRSTFDDNGNPTSNVRRQITVVDRANDPVLQHTIDDARQKFGELPPKERAQALNKYVHDVMTPKNMNSDQLDNWYSQFSQAHKGENVMLGEFITQGKGVCSQQATLMKVLGDELDLDVRLVRGAGMDGSKAINHAWVDVNLPGQNERLICDPRWNVANVKYDAINAHVRGAEIENDGKPIPAEPHANEPIVKPSEQAVPSPGDSVPSFLKNPVVAKGFGGTLGVIGVGAGFYQTYQGMQMIMHGDTGAGVVNMTGGVANTGAGVLGLGMLSSSAPAWMSAGAMKLGGVGTILGGGLELYNGVKNHDGLQIGEGTMYTTTGTMMLAAGASPVGMGAAVFAGSYGTTRFVMEHTGGDKAVTWAMDGVMNHGANKEANSITEQNLSNLQNSGDKVVGRSYDEIKANNVTSKDVSQVILGLREKMENQNGDELNASRAEVVRLINIRGQLSQAS